jgi:hypothetical protein
MNELLNMYDILARIWLLFQFVVGFMPSNGYLTIDVQTVVFLMSPRGMAVSNTNIFPAVKQGLMLA